MENILLHEYRIPIKGVKKKTFYQFSDVHLNEYDDLSSDAEVQYAKSPVAQGIAGKNEIKNACHKGS